MPGLGPRPAVNEAVAAASGFPAWVRTLDTGDGPGRPAGLGVEAHRETVSSTTIATGTRRERVGRVLGNRCWAPKRRRNAFGPAWIVTR